MFVLKSKAEWAVAVALAVLMAVTRVHHFGIGAIAPDASTGVFFLAGLLVASPWLLVALLVQAVLLDGLAIGFMNVADACMSSGYLLLVPAYSALWFAGRAMRTADQIDAASVAKFAGLAVAGTIVFFVVSNLGYFLGSDYYNLGLIEYITRVSRYFPTYLGVTLFYIALGVAAYFAARRIGVLETSPAR